MGKSWTISQKVKAAKQAIETKQKNDKYENKSVFIFNYPWSDINFM